MTEHVFICYARKDQAFVLALASNLKQQGVSVWIDQWDIPPGVDWDDAIEEAIDACAHFLIVLSPASVQSREVRGELRMALDEDKPVLPVLYQECRIPRQLRIINYTDFTHGNASHEEALASVLSALGVDAASRAPKTVTPKPAPTEKAPLYHGPIDFDWMRVPAGEFTVSQDALSEDAGQTVDLPEFFVAKRPVTNAQYKRFVGATNHRVPQTWEQGQIPTGQEDRPVRYVSWDDAQAFCHWAEVDLPGEAQWEKAMASLGVDDTEFWEWVCSRISGESWYVTKTMQGGASAADRHSWLSSYGFRCVVVPTSR